MRIPNRINEKSFWAAACGTVLSSLCFLAFAAPCVYAQNAKLDLSHLDKLAKKASSVKNVNLDGPMLKQAGLSQMNLLGSGDEGKSVAGRLKGIYVRKYEFDKPGEYSKEDVASLLKQVRSGKWSPVVTKEDKESGSLKGIYVMDEGGETVGLAIIKLDPREVSIVNLVGPVNLGALTGLGKPQPQLQHRSKSRVNPDPSPNP